MQILLVFNCARTDTFDHINFYVLNWNKMTKTKKKNSTNSQYGNQHHLSKAYLRGFVVKKSQVAVYDLLKKESGGRSIDNINSEKDFFSFEGAEEASKYYGIDIDKHCLDKELQLHESILGQILKSIRKNQSFEDLHILQIRFLLQWVGWLIIANPDTRAYLKQKHSWFTNTQICSAFISWMNKIHPAVLNKSWGLGFCKEDLLLTSDRPVIITNAKLETPRDIVALSNATIILPLSPKIALIGELNAARGPAIMKPKELSADRIDILNNLTYKNARSLLIANDKALLQKFINMNINAK